MSADGAIVMTWEIVIFWWFGGPVFVPERFGAWPSQEICDVYLQGEVDVAWKLRPGLRGVLGACYPKGAFPPFEGEGAFEP